MVAGISLDFTTTNWDLTTSGRPPPLSVSSHSAHITINIHSILWWFVSAKYKLSTARTMELENSQNNALAKLPMLKLGEYEMWEIDSQAVLSDQRSALWEVIENEDSWVPNSLLHHQIGPFNSIEDDCGPHTTDRKDLKEYVDAQSLFIASKLALVEMMQQRSQRSLTEATVKRTVAVNNDDKNLAFLTTSSPSTLHDDDLEEMDLSGICTAKLRADSSTEIWKERFIIYGSVGLIDKSKVECFNCNLKWDILPENAEHQEVKTTEIGIQGSFFIGSLENSTTEVDKDWKEKFFHPANHVRVEEPKKARENTAAPIIEDWVSDDEEEVEPIPKVEKKIATPTATKKKSVKPEKPIRRSSRPNVNTVRARGFNAVKPSACWVWRPIKPNGASLSNSQLNDKGFVDSGCSRHMSGNIAHLSDFKDFDGGYVTFGGGANGGRITGKGTIKTDKLDFEDVYFVKELQFNLFSVSQMCDKKNYVLFTDSECLVLSPNFKLPDESQILLKIPRQNNKNIIPKDGLTCLVAKATSEESMLWHRRLGHVNFKNINKLVKENLVRDLPLKRFENDQTCVACLKGKQHRASCKTKAFNPITKPLFMLHMDLFGPTFVSSLMHKKYCLVVTDDYSRFSWVFFLKTKDETSEILKNFIKEIENLVDKKVKIIRSDNGTEFKNKVMDEFCREKGIKR
ncbi:putative ribonuclease H-like domain-containing protein [Tanacetum coccineum]